MFGWWVSLINSSGWLDCDWSHNLKPTAAMMNGSYACQEPYYLKIVSDSNEQIKMDINFCKIYGGVVLELIL